MSGAAPRSGAALAWRGAEATPRIISLDWLCICKFCLTKASVTCPVYSAWASKVPLSTFFLFKIEMSPG